jgi:hypothetical protein
MTVCEEAAINLDWQFTVNAQEGDLKNESPLVASGIIDALCPYNPGAGPQCVADAEWALMETLAYGQRHNAGAQQTYRDCRNGFGSRWEFYT